MSFLSSIAIRLPDRRNRRGVLAAPRPFLCSSPIHAKPAAFSGYQLLYRWLRARQGEELSGESGVALLRGALDIAWRIDELSALMDEADAVLARSLEDTLTRADLGLPPRDAAAPASGGEEDATA